MDAVKLNKLKLDSDIERVNAEEFEKVLSVNEFATVETPRVEVLKTLDEVIEGANGELCVVGRSDDVLEGSNTEEVVDSTDDADVIVAEVKIGEVLFEVKFATADSEDETADKDERRPTELEDDDARNEEDKETADRLYICS
jgi:ABC-type sulfate/molybdate transport systems ATPase subunit